MTRPFLLVLAAALLSGPVLSACSPTISTHGDIVDPDRLAQIKPGVTTRDDVAGILGTPSTTSTFDPNVWYYIGERTEKVAFFTPDVLDRKVIVLQFEPDGVVRQVDQLDLSAARQVALVDRQTPTAGKELTFLEQMLGNLGRFNNNNTSPVRRPGGPGGGY